MHHFKFAIAQVASMKGDVESNIATHLKAIIKASELGVSYLVFPELSLTGYEPELASKLAFSKSDKRLNPLINASVKYNVTIAVGAPLVSDGLPEIGLIIISPTNEIETYSKMNLHPGEDNYFIQGDQHHYVEISATKIVNAICADSNNSDHVEYCLEIGASVYIAGVLISETGYSADTTALKNYAKKFNILVAMANHNRATGIWQPIGKSAIWSNTGLLAQANENQDALLVAEKLDEHWTAQLFEM
ncbi:MAG: carbon-nitrogen hydrolase family protein [Psychromonas sp.]|nr:carbon-nitrogen hydrolase family protein [Alteromonadales bacterium]MCP5076874.1 carbon-nitrogen hydrolase family protein [Psychromonas sp.]